MRKTTLDASLVRHMIIARIFLAGAGRIETSSKGEVFHLPGGEMVSFFAKPPHQMQMLRDDGRPLSVPLSPTDLESVKSLMHNVDLSILGNDASLPISFFALADQLGSDILAGEFVLDRFTSAIESGAYSSGFLREPYAMDLLNPWIERYRDDVSMGITVRKPDIASMIRWCNWADAIERQEHDLEPKRIVTDAHVWQQIMTNSARFGLTMRTEATFFGSLIGDARNITASLDDKDLYALENDRGQIDLIVATNPGTGQVIAACGTQAWQDKKDEFERLIGLLEAETAATVPAPTL